MRSGTTLFVGLGFLIMACGGASAASAATGGARPSSGSAATASPTGSTATAEGTTGAGATANPSNVVAGELLVSFREVPQIHASTGAVTVQWDSVNALMAQLHVSALRPVFEGPHDATARAHGLDRAFVLTVPESTNLASTIRLLQADAHVESAETNNLVTADRAQ